MSSVYLKQVDFINCQSLENHTFQFRKGLNVLVARNNTGKSVFMKMAKISACPTIYTAEERRELIRKGKDHCMARYVFSDNSASAVLITHKGLLYFYSENILTHELEPFLEPHPEHIRKMAFIVDNKSSFFANMLDQDQALFLVKSSSAESNSILKLYTTHEEMELAISNLENNISEYRVLYSDLEREYYATEMRLSELVVVDINKLELKKKRLEPALRVFDPMVEIYKIIHNTDVVDQEEDYERNLSLLDLAEQLTQISKVEVFEEQKLFDDSLLDICEKFVSTCGDVSLFEEQSVISDNILSTCESLLSLKDSVYNLFVEEYTELLSSDFLGNLITVGEIVEESYSLLLETEKLREEMLELDRSLNNAEEYPCPIYGRVLHVEETCIPHSDGLTFVS